ncbi:MAG TPA: hypothetical protein PKC69_05515 [Chitinophagaceae bacterium]|nr:hypothetical protein [Chitinophagaceae bacterium]
MTVIKRVFNIVVVLCCLVGGTSVSAQIDGNDYTDPATLAKMVTKKIKLQSGKEAWYYGELSNSGVPHGYGKLEYPDGRVYEGNWKEGSQDGKGKETTPGGDVYIGEFKNGIRSGYGKYTWKSGKAYEGDMANNNLHGKGKMVFPDGNVYQGSFTNGQANGKGKMLFANGDVYEGDFKGGKRTGKGKVVYANGNVYEGEWLDNIRSGKGKMTIHDVKSKNYGNAFDGEWKNDSPLKGTYTWKNGDRYEGEMVNNNLHGKGKKTYADGKVEEGNWENGKFTGE